MGYSFWLNTTRQAEDKSAKQTQQELPDNNKGRTHTVTS
jgi:hypothetical protein